MFKLPHNCAHFTRQQGNAQNPSGKASTICELRTSRCTSWIWKRQRNQRSNCQHSIGSWRKQGSSASLTPLKPLTVWIITNWEILKEMGIPDHLTCLLRNLQQVKKLQLEPDTEQLTGPKLGKENNKTGYCHPAYLTYSEYIMLKARLDDSQAGIKIAGRNSNNLRQAGVPL